MQKLEVISLTGAAFLSSALAAFLASWTFQIAYETTLPLPDHSKVSKHYDFVSTDTITIGGFVMLGFMIFVTCVCLKTAFDFFCLLLDSDDLEKSTFGSFFLPYRDRLKNDYIKKFQIRLPRYKIETKE